MAASRDSRPLGSSGGRVISAARRVRRRASCRARVQAMRAALLLGLLVACSVRLALAPWLGAWRAVPAILALGAAGGSAVAWCRACAGFHEIGTRSIPRRSRVPARVSRMAA
jgi:hypothetical protein